MTGTEDERGGAAGIGDALRAERRRQGRTLADAAAETRVRESYLAAIEDEDFDVLGGDVYARGFIRLYGRYLGLDAEALVATFRREHERPEEITAIPGATIDDVMPARRAPQMALSQPVLAAGAIVLVLVVLFLLLRGGGEDEAAELDPNAPGPSPAATTPSEGGGVAAPTATATAAPGAGATEPLAPPPAPPSPGAGEVLTEVVVAITALQPVQVTVDQGQPPMTGRTLQAGESETITDPGGQQVVFTVSDFGATEITVNGGPLDGSAFTGQAVQITCAVGQVACTALPL